MQRRATLAALAASLAASLAPACAERPPPLPEPFGRTTLSSATSVGEESDYLPGSIELYVARRAPDPCGAESLPAVRFASGSDDVDPADELVLHELARCFAAPPWDAATIVLVGHADPRGSSRDNLELGRARASAVKELLVTHGVPPHRVVVTSAGEAGLPRSWADARRVDIVVEPVREGSPAVLVSRPGSSVAPREERDRRRPVEEGVERDRRP